MFSTRLIYNKFKKIDFDDYFKLTGNASVMKWITGHASTLEASKKIFEKVLQTNAQHAELGYFAIRQTENNRFIGLGKIVMKNDIKAEIGYALLPEFWGKGYGSEISETLVKYAKVIPYIKEIIAIIDPDNLPSKKILLKCNFELDTVCILENLPAEIYKLK